MIYVDAVVWYWTSQGMRNQNAPGVGGMGMNRYIEASQVERLLEEAYLRGFNDAKARAIEFVSRAS